MTTATPADGAFWIGADHPFDLAECYLNFRRDLMLHEAPAKAIFTPHRRQPFSPVDQWGICRPWPGAVLAASHGTGYAGCHPATSAPRPNHLAVQVYSPGYSHFAYVHKAAAGWLGWLEIDGALCPSDRQWHVSRDASYSALTHRVSIYGTGVELRDMTTDTDWQTTATPTWAQARIVQPPEGPMWAGLHLRDIPRQTDRTPSPADRSVANPPRPHAERHPRPAPRPSRRLHRLPARRNPSHPRRKPDRNLDLDLGHSQICTACATIQNASGGESLSVSVTPKNSATAKSC